jgi:hypothetical protein
LTSINSAGFPLMKVVTAGGTVATGSVDASTQGGSSQDGIPGIRLVDPEGAFRQAVPLGALPTAAPTTNPPTQATLNAISAGTQLPQGVYTVCVVGGVAYLVVNVAGTIRKVALS